MPRRDDDAVARLTVRLDGATLWQDRPAYAELVHRALRAGLAGASVFHDFEGSGPGGGLHHADSAHFAPRGPCSVLIVDGEQQLREFLGTVQDVLEHARAAVSIDVVRHHSTARGRP
ncbi:DUF190 domain-containing protein [Streptomyces sp. NBC_01304]|uniref:DUF190 domain-containing protein n=1 Tax=Streptomyces sp. NBC_01304 TaxID=2903818 RepID=UPI002E14F8EA|nr:DUF190 domain-containing protein [Streptomyces sp. NBC_01304]